MKSTSTDTQQVCGSCDKPVSKNKVSLTAWIFGDTNCRCPIPNLKPQTPVVVAAISAALTTQTPPATLVIAERYEVLTPIGEGGMGTVYKVRDIELDAIFAVKTLRKELVQEPQASKRFEQEVEAARELNHANLVTVYDHGLSLDQTPYLVMDFIDGPTLAQVLGQEHSLEPAMALNIFVQICDAVDHAHEHGVIHRDLKPSNIMVVTRPDQLPLVKVVDFGIAKVLPTISRETLNLTKTGEVFGSPIYMSPEQCMGERLDTRSDIYSLGCLMYETLTGSPPFKEENSVKTIVQHLTEQPKPCGVMATGLHVPPDLEKVVMRCLEKDPSARYQSASELLKELQAMQFKYWKKRQ
jgi:serine/threonine protein kinase